MDALLVEDSALIRERLVPLLASLASVRVVAVADNERDAAAWLRANDCDLVLVDLLLRQGSGFGVLQSVGGSDTLRVVLSNEATPEVRRRCRELGASAFFDKSRQLDECFGWLRDQAATRSGRCASRST